MLNLQHQTAKENQPGNAGDSQQDVGDDTRAGLAQVPEGGSYRDEEYAANGKDGAA